jgi:hypothetical protein
VDHLFPFLFSTDLELTDRFEAVLDLPEDLGVEAAADAGFFVSVAGFDGFVRLVSEVRLAVTAASTISF